MASGGTLTESATDETACIDHYRCCHRLARRRIRSCNCEDRPVTKAPPKTMGDEGKLPATDTVTGKVPDMGSTTVEPNTATPPVDATALKTMGDEGKLPGHEVYGRTSSGNEAVGQNILDRLASA